MAPSARIGPGVAEERPPARAVRQAGAPVFSAMRRFAVSTAFAASRQ